MEARGLLFVVFAETVIRGALSARPPNVTYCVEEETCSLMVKWQREKHPVSNCTRYYKVVLNADGITLSNNCLTKTDWTTKVLLGKKNYFGVQMSCNKDCDDIPHWNDDEAFHVVQNGSAGTGARDINCIWWNRKYMECSWLPGENAGPDTSYKMSYKYDRQLHQCKNVTRKGSLFLCSFDCVIGTVPVITISVQGDSENIQPTCALLKSLDTLVKLHPPHITHLSRNGTEVFLKWTEPERLFKLQYEVEVTSGQDNSEPVIKPYQRSGGETVSVDPDGPHAFRVRVKTEHGQWSDWSPEKVLGPTSSTFPILLFILIPLCVALLSVILLFYLKRIKRLILPKIPDPEQILKSMFQDQNENQSTHETVNKEETHALMIVEPVEPVGSEK